MDFNPYDLFLVTPVLFLFFVSLVPIMLKAFRGGREPGPHAVNAYGFVGLLGAAGLTLVLQNNFSQGFSKAIIFDGYSVIASLSIFIATAFTLLFSANNLNTRISQYSEYVFLILNAAIGMVLVALSNDLIFTFIGIELMSLCLYMIIAVANEQRRSKEAAIKYFVLGSFSSAIFLYGVSFIYGSSGTTYLDEIANIGPILGSNYLFIFGVIMVLLGFGFKLALFPFQSWAPDVYEGSPTPITGFMATGVKLVAFVALLRFILAGIWSLPLVETLEWLALLTIFAGNLAALTQTNLKRMLAYSGIAHSGYALLGVIATGVSQDNSLEASSVIFYVVAYTFMILGAFGFVSFLEKKEDSSIELKDLKGLSSKNSALALCFSIFMLALLGVPPLSGFFTKFFIIGAAIKQGFFWLSIWAVIGSAISAYYYLKPLVFMYMFDPEDDRTYSASKNLSGALAIYMAAIMTVLLGVFASPLYEFISKSLS